MKSYQTIKALLTLKSFFLSLLLEIHDTNFFSFETSCLLQTDDLYNSFTLPPTSDIAFQKYPQYHLFSSHMAHPLIL